MTFHSNETTNPLKSTCQRDHITGWLSIALLCLVGAFLLCWGLSPGEASTDASDAVSAHQGHPKYQTRAIQDVRIFDWVLARNPQVTDIERAQFDEIDYRECRQISLQMHKADGGTLDVVLARPNQWFEANRVTIGGTIHLDLREMGADGEAHVKHISDCLDPGPKPHPDCRLVTGTFAHSVGHTIDVYVEGLDEPIGTTANHLWWSVDRQTFVEAGQLCDGERLRTPDGTLTQVASRTPRLTTKPVYNLEVDGEHVYYVSQSGVLVHNRYVRRYVSRREMKQIKKHGIIYDPNAGDGIPTTTQNFTARSQGHARGMTGARSAQYEIDFDTGDLLEGPTKVTKGGLPEYPIQGDLLPDMITNIRRVPE